VSSFDEGGAAARAKIGCMPVIDDSDDFGARAARHLRDEVVVWFTSVSPAGAPLPRPVWFVWDGADAAMIYSMPGARVRNIEANPRVTLNFAGDGRGGDIVVISGRATADRELASAAENPDYLAKYTEQITRIGHTPESFAERYSVPVRIAFTRLDGH
jgi:PPOX class probable F420-dependent enzyme